MLIAKESLETWAYKDDCVKADPGLHPYLHSHINKNQKNQWALCPDWFRFFVFFLSLHPEPFLPDPLFGLWLCVLRASLLENNTMEESLRFLAC